MNINEARFVLGLFQPLPTLIDLKKAYKELMLQWHPDIAQNKGISIEEATKKSQQINLAYEILSEKLDQLEEIKFNYSFESYYHYKTTTNRTYRQYYDYTIDDIDARFVNRITIKSSNVKWIDYINDLEILVVRFKGSSCYYLYYNVPEIVFEKFKTADSPGRFVHQFLHRYKYDSLKSYADWLNVYKCISEITESTKST